MMLSRRGLDTETPQRDGNIRYVMNVILNGCGRNGRQTLRIKGMYIVTPLRDGQLPRHEKHPKAQSSGLCCFGKKETGGSGPRRAELEYTVPTIKIFSMLD